MIKTGKTALAAAALITMMSCTQQNEDLTDSRYIGPSDIRIEDGIMTPEALLSLGRLSDPQLSPDGRWILYGVSYTSIEENRSCRNLFLAEVVRNDNGALAFGDKIQLTAEGKSVSNARWDLDGKSIYYLQGGQIYRSAVNIADGKASLSGKSQVSDIKAGIGEFTLSPDQSQVIYTSTVPGTVKTPKDFDEKLDKAQAYVTEDLMYRHWDHWTTERPQSYVAPMGEGKSVTEENSKNLLAEGAGKYELPLEPLSGIEQLCWSPDGRHVAYSCKKLGTGREYAFSTNTEIYIYTIATGGTVRIPMGGGYDTNPVWSPDGKHIAWLSMSRDGYEADKVRLMVAGISEDVTEGSSDALQVSGIRDLTVDFKYNAADIFWTFHLEAGIIFFAIKLVICDDRSFRGDFPRRITDDRRLRPVCIFDPKLRKQTRQAECFHSRITHREETAVPQNHSQCILVGSHQSCHIIYIIIYTFIIQGRHRGKHVLADFLSVQVSLIRAKTGNIQDGSFHRPIRRKLFTQISGGQACFIVSTGHTYLLTRIGEGIFADPGRFPFRIIEQGH